MFDIGGGGAYFFGDIYSTCISIHKLCVHMPVFLLLFSTWYVILWVGQYLNYTEHVLVRANTETLKLYGNYCIHNNIGRRFAELEMKLVLLLAQV